MPMAAVYPCTTCGQQGCTQHTRVQDRARGTAQQRGYTYQWHKARTAYLQQHPLCVECQQQQTYTPATVVDHIMPHRGDMTLFWNEANWQSLCKRCHDAKTGRGL